MSPFQCNKSPTFFRFFGLATALCLLSAASVAKPHKVTRQVVVQQCYARYVIDGDTFICQFAQGQEQRVRLLDIDSPERAQPFYHVSRRALRELIEKRIVTLHTTGRDRYHRLLSRVYDAQGQQDVNLKMLELGLAWVYHYSDNAQYKAAEQQARAAKRGLWQDARSQDPYYFRKQHKRQP
ncbi:thermonuclease family protein [Spirabiliibacterium mucosae]|uniref:thermonuclease family protein n=1 Tax=Spirabiliibacterium mucosae TaxID=28156 RepID=UPI001AADC6FD|nr:thermonuclease family protein [Spirabiliibacterium mucosae]